MGTTVNRSWLDIAIETHGNLEGVFELAAANNTSITQLPGRNKDIISVNSSLSNQLVVETLRSAKIVPGTVGDPDLQSGIGYWIIEETFQVQ